MTNEKPERLLAKIERCGIFTTHGIVVLGCTFKYTEHGTCQGISPRATYDNIKSFMEAIGISELDKSKDKSCWVTATYGEILKIEPLHKDEGTPMELRAAAQ